ncbi:hypothetical protein KAH94_06475 [bacterium]|nr:hypothetical protein [bacterium]
MDLETVSDTRIIEITIGVVIGILSFIFGKKKERKKIEKENNKNNNNTDLKNVKTL